MDHHAMMWDAATADLSAEAAQAALVNALAELSGVRDFTHAAATSTEYTHRAALTEQRVAEACRSWGADPNTVQQQLDASYSHVTAARQAAAEQRARLAREAAAKAPSAPPTPAKTPPAPESAPETPGAPAEPPAAEATAKTSKPRTLPTGGNATPMPMPAPVAPGVAPGPAPMASGPAAPGAQAAPAGASKTASKRQRIEDEISALNPHLPATTITRLAKAAMRHLAAEPLAYGNWDNPSDGPITHTLKNWAPPRGHSGSPQDSEAGLSPTDSPDDSPAGPAAAGTASATAAPADSAIADAIIAAASAP